MVDGFDIQSGFAGSNIRARSAVLDEFITCLRETIDRKREAEIPIYTNGAEYWRDLMQVSVSLDAALFVGGKNIDAKARSECTVIEKQFCRELFTAMYEDTAAVTDPVRLVYPYTSEIAEERMETPYYQTSAVLNSDCARAIDLAIHQSRYKNNHYNHDLAAMKVIHDFGFSRVSLVLAHNARYNNDSGGVSPLNMRWADGFGTTGGGFAGAMMDTHPTLIDQFMSHVRELYNEVNADRFVLPGQAEKGETERGYEIIRAIGFDNGCGFAIGLNPVADPQFVTWQFTAENDYREYHRGNYRDDLQGAAANYIARVAIHMTEENAKEVQRPPAAAELPISAAETPELNESEQNFKAWMAVTESSRYKWVEDEIYRLNGRGAMYYTGGEDGVYMRISKDGSLEAGNYEGAFPHIGEAFFMPVVTKQYDTFSAAYTAAMEAGGKRFMVDMFSGSETQPLHQTMRGAAAEKPSVIKQIRDAQNTPKPPRADKSPEQRKKKGDVDL